jgi:hypothetical protein
MMVQTVSCPAHSSTKNQVMNTKTFSLIFGFIFIAVGILGFLPNPIIGESEGAIFHADTVHNIVHIASGILFLFIALIIPGAAGTFLKIFGIVYLALGIMGLVNFGTDGMGELLGVLHVNGPDNFLHIGLGLVIFLAGFAGAKKWKSSTF